MADFKNKKHGPGRIQTGYEISQFKSILKHLTGVSPFLCAPATITQSVAGHERSSAKQQRAGRIIMSLDSICLTLGAITVFCSDGLGR